MKALAPTAQQKIEFNYVEPGWMELAYISPDWKVWNDKSLQNLCVEAASDILEIPTDQINKTFYWAEDFHTNHKHLFVKINMIPKDRSPSDYKHIKSYMNGFMDAVGHM